ncbi:tetratricopeptide repeat protein [Bacillus sp. FDAARGOS_1420]|uniref:response regulator aspartate phosphatase n=2 Tax=unclassified Bacillus (in: firmicutes) TaxID=185979 RepID=UPI001C5A9C3E|nr:tetratricopeptide repeat protein [Bacillus sp. FDAARGOS_1420]MBW3496551.1 tetratricopeptide repeat protein [Bacillus sp. FDAARGOS_1420]MBW3496686.1 tetratricopeptide repeat protein [Bacillus sp. FDAARGOS_1420]
MSVSVKTNEQLTSLLNEWYQSMLSQQVLKATNLKKKIDKKISTLSTERNQYRQDQNLLLYYSLLEFRYTVLTDGLSIQPNSLDSLDEYDMPTDQFLHFYYHFFKAIHATFTTNYTKAIEYYKQAEKILIDIPDEIEHAEFYYRIATFYHHTYNILASIEYANKSKKIFSKHEGYEIKTAFCNSLLGGCCIYVKQYEQAEVYLNAAIDLLKENHAEDSLLHVRNTIGWLYSDQNKSTLAIRQLSEVTAKVPTHFKAIFLQAKEHYKLGEQSAASPLIDKGLQICKKINNEEYTHHFSILNSLNKNISLEELEKIIQEGLIYFEKKELWDYVVEYAELFATLCRQLGDYKKVSDYFHICYQAKRKILKKGALK